MKSAKFDNLPPAGAPWGASVSNSSAGSTATVNYVVPAGNALVITGGGIWVLNDADGYIRQCYATLNGGVFANAYGSKYSGQAGVYHTDSCIGQTVIKGGQTVSLGLYVISSVSGQTAGLTGYLI
jgi:hypothetical protein